MNKYILSIKAESDLEGIYIYHSSYSYNSVKNISKKFKSSFNNLKDFPKFGKVCEDNENYRELPCGNYIIYYGIKSEHIVIHRIVDTKVSFEI